MLDPNSGALTIRPSRLPQRDGPCNVIYLVVYYVELFLLDGDASLIFSKGNSIQRMSLPPRPNNIGVIYQKAGAVHVGVDYDCVDQTVYWTEVTKGVIVRAKYDGSDMEVVINSGEITSPEGERKQAYGFFTGSIYSLIIIKLKG